MEVADQRSDAIKPSAAGVPNPNNKLEVSQMSITELDSKVKDLRELRRMAEELDGEIEAVQDTIKAKMTARGTEEAHGTDWRITWKPVTNERLDSKALKADLPEVATRYLRQSTARRFVVTA